MKEFTDKSLNIAKLDGASYSDIRIVEYNYECLKIKNGNIGEMTQNYSIGFGVRVLVNGAWGFASSPVLSNSEIEKVTKIAIEIAKASSKVKEEDVRFSKNKAYIDFWQTPFIIDPFKVSTEEKLNLMYKVDDILKKNDKIKSRICNMEFVNEHKWFASSEGSFIEQNLLRSGGGYEVTAVGNNDSQTRSFPMSFGGQYKSVGYELILSLKLLENAERIREEAVSLLTADVCPKGNRDLVLLGNQLFLQIHESVGHATELDRVFGYEENYAGSSFATTEKLNNFKYGSPIVNFLADSTIPTGLATFGYDDDGVKADRWYIVKDGILTGYMTNRETAHKLNQDNSNGCNRSQGFTDIPITRIANLSLMPGKLEYDELIGDISDGVIMDTNRCWSIDQKRLNFEFGCEVGWEIKNGKITRMLKNPIYQGITYDFWNKCDGICNYKYWDLWGVVNCGKGQPTQIMYMSHGGAPCRFRDINIG